MDPDLGDELLEAIEILESKFGKLEHLRADPERWMARDDYIGTGIFVRAKNPEGKWAAENGSPG